MELDVKEIVKGFGYELKDYTKIRNVYKCMTNDGIKSLREDNRNVDKIEVEYLMKKHLFENGFTTLDLNILDIETKKPYVINSSKGYVMSNWIEGRECDLENDDEMEMAVKNLARLHECSKGFLCPSELMVRSDIGKLPEFYDKRKKELERIKSKIKKETMKTEVEKKYFSSADLFIDEAKLAQEILDNSKYDKLVKSTLEEKSFCHHDYAFHNIIIDENNDLNVIDYEYATYEIRVYDIANVIKRSMRKCNWDINKTLVMLEYYDSISKLTKEELEVLFAMLVFPQKLWRIMNRYYNGKKNFSFDLNIQKVVCEIDLYPYHQKYIEDYEKLVLN